MEASLVAPCGMNCAVCSSYLAYTHDLKRQGVRLPCCPGCRPRHKQCANLKKKCELLLNEKIQYCYECPDFPCVRLRHIDRRYRTLYKTGLVENLMHIREYGIGLFLEIEENKWRCPSCGGVICCHNGICYNCGLDKLKEAKQRSRWQAKAG